MPTSKNNRKSLITVNSLNELTDALFEGSLNQRLMRFRSDMAFRGVGDASWDLRTSLMRLGGNYPLLEGPILRSFRKYANRNPVSGDSVWNWLTLAQHHGLPTRLLDWTFSPYVAMHFATCEPEHMEKDSAIWCVDFVKANHLLPPRLHELLKDHYANGFTVEMLSEVAAELKVFDALRGQEEFVVFFEPPSLDDRVVNQYALFSVMPNNQGQLHLWLLAHPDCYRKIVIPSSLKWEIRDKLDQANINERTMYPGLDGLSQWLKRHYSPGPKNVAQKTMAARSGR
ncbi:MAG TPA: FRG domain-containing protein [Candidatus Angelobacter sp.]|jgi:hypothetical protein|nr:FRG domain-containing protein [Candidatus Angelobacter sp.]